MTCALPRRVNGLEAERTPLEAITFRRATAPRVTSTGCQRGFGPDITGGFIERIVADSTRAFNDAAVAAGVPTTYVVRPDGSHTWGLFESEMQQSWNTTVGLALGVR